MNSTHGRVADANMRSVAKPPSAPSPHRPVEPTNHKMPSGRLGALPKETSGYILNLQQMAGNQAVQFMLTSAATQQSAITANESTRRSPDQAADRYRSEPLKAPSVVRSGSGDPTRGIPGLEEQPNSYPSGRFAILSAADNNAPTNGIIQRWTNPVVSLKSNADLISAALNEDDVAAAKQIDDVSGLSNDQKLQIVDLLNRKGDGWGRDAEVALKLWRSFGTDLLAVANSDGGGRWKSSVGKTPSLATDLQPIADLRTQFPQDVLALAQSTLEGNRNFVMEKMTELGISLDPGVTGAQPTQDEETRIQDLQNAAAAVARLQAAQEHARTLNVGWRMATEGPPPGSGFAGEPGAGPMPTMGPSATYFYPQTYDPLAKPEYIQQPMDTPPLVNVLGKGTVLPYQEVDDKFKATATWVEFFLGRFPELYAIVREGKSADTAAFSSVTDPRAARDQLGAAMHKLLKDIEHTTEKLGGDLNVLDLVPVHTRMTQQGIKPPGGAVAWNEPVQAKTAMDLVADHDFNQALAAIGIELAANALFLLAPITGVGALFALLGGVTILGAKAKMSADRAADLTEAAATAAKPGTALVSDVTVDAAQKEAESDKAAVALAILQAGTETAFAAAAQSGTKIAELEARMNTMLKDPLLIEGSHTGGYIEPSGPRVTSYESQTIQVLGEEYGCHSCGAKDPGQYGTWVGDHQPPTALVDRNIASAGHQILVPHCEICSSRQGNLVREIVKVFNELQLAKGLPGSPDVVPPVLTPPASNEPSSQ